MNSFTNSGMMTNECVEGNNNNLKVSVSRCSKMSSSELSSDMLIQNYSNFKRSSVPERFMFYGRGSWVDYTEEVGQVMKLGFSEGKPMIEAEIQGLDRVFDFFRMLEIELKSGNQRSISWIDVNGKCFFPKVFVNSFDNDDDDDDDSASCDENYPKIEIEIKVRENSSGLKGSETNKTEKLSKRKRENNAEKEKVETSSSNINAKRPKIVCENELQSARWPKTIILGGEEKGYTIVKNLFLSGLEIVEQGATVTVINQCVRTGPLDKARCQVFAKQMEITKQARGESNMVFAWYGTSAKGVESILMHGFGLPSMLASRCEGPGMGIHLSPIRSPQTSAMLSEIDENGEKHVILCRVILGKCEKVEAGSQQSHPSSIEYDTGVDDLKNPKWYTVWHANMNTHILPECVISYRPVNVSGSVKGAPSVNWVPDPSVFITELPSKLKSYLPMPKIQELRTLCGSYKEGKLGKNVFMQQLRTVVGDDVLRCTIHEICG